MRILISILFFYKKLVIPVLAMSVMIAVLAFLMSNTVSFKWFGISFLIATPMFHYYMYEARNPNEYYFYYNMGISKLALWVSTLILSSLISLILIHL